MLEMTSNMDAYVPTPLFPKVPLRPDRSVITNATLDCSVGNANGWRAKTKEHLAKMTDINVAHRNKRLVVVDVALHDDRRVLKWGE